MQQNPGTSQEAVREQQYRALMSSGSTPTTVPLQPGQDFVKLSIYDSNTSSVTDTNTSAFVRK